MTDPATILVRRCSNCHSSSLPREGPCPRCGSPDVAPQSISSEGAVLASTELQNPSVGWSSPHRLALVELADSVRVLALVLGPLPEVGSRQRVERDGDRYVVRSAATPP
jgi:uncharacterized OB-fold protein